MSKILITNDDGIQSDGIIRLAMAAKAFGEVWVVAPDDQRSAASHSVTLHSSISVQAVSFPVPGVHAYSCDGTPSDCVRLGVLNLVPSILQEAVPGPEGAWRQEHLRGYRWGFHAHDQPFP